MIISLYTANPKYDLIEGCDNTIVHIMEGHQRIEIHMPHDQWKLLSIRLHQHFFNANWPIPKSNQNKSEMPFCIHESTRSIDNAIVCNVCNQIIAP